MFLLSTFKLILTRATNRATITNTYLTKPVLVSLWVSIECAYSQTLSSLKIRSIYVCSTTNHRTIHMPWIRSLWRVHAAWSYWLHRSFPPREVSSSTFFCIKNKWGSQSKGGNAFKFPSLYSSTRQNASIAIARASKN